MASASVFRTLLLLACLLFTQASPAADAATAAPAGPAVADVTPIIRTQGLGKVYSAGTEAQVVALNPVRGQ